MSILKLKSLLIAISVYLVLIIAIFFGAFYQPSIPKAKIYTDKKSEIIEVSLGKPKRVISKKVSKNKKIVHHKKRRKKPKKIRNVKKVVKRKAKIVKSSKKVKKVSKKSVKKDISSLFKNIPKSIKEDSKKSVKSSGANGKSLKKSNKKRGIVNAYFAKVQRILEGWPAQYNFAGEKVSVELTIYPSGLFDYKILRKSLNPEFNRALKEYLEQLKRVGFGPHSNPKPYKIVVEFIAKG